MSGSEWICPPDSEPAIGEFRDLDFREPSTAGRSALVAAPWVPPFVPFPASRTRMSIQDKVAEQKLLALSVTHKPNPALTSIDTSIATQLESVRQLRSKRNGLAPISRLSPELLAQIFIEYAMCTDMAAEPAMSFRPDVWWIATTHVCRHWREVGLGTPRLWSRPPFKKPKWAQEMLIRSKSAPLQVYATIGNVEHLRAVESALKHMSRIQVLSIAGPSSELGKLSLSSPAPLLESLSLNNWTEHDRYSIPTNAFNLENPSLRKLELRQCSPNWGSPMYGGLSALKVEAIPKSARPTLPQLLQILAGMPRLESLSLLECLPTHPSSQPHPSSRSPSSGTTAIPHPTSIAVNLDKLVTLQLQGASLDCTALLSSLSINPKTRLNLETYSPVLAHFEPFFKSTISLGLSTPMLGLRVSSQYGSVRLRWYDRLGPDPYKPEFGSRVMPDITAPHTEIFLNRLSGPDSNDGYGELVVGACGALDLRHLEVMQLSGSIDTGTIPYKWWRSLFGKSVKLKLLSIEGHTCFDFVAAIGRGIDLEGPASPGKEPAGKAKAEPSSTSTSTTAQAHWQEPLLFPQLKKLEVHGAGFEMRWHSNPFIDSSFSELLLKSLRSRKRGGKQVEELELVACSYISEDDVVRLGKVVGRVDWDGEGGADEDEDEDEDDTSDEGEDYMFSDYY
ncbi:hypothetical protein JAAARDRAFT_190185 [Jaapia argillacea MUCL 33604]|uniref:Uncharacterized protein n=1 Tax=Jaapia argillacea MUCL 33604 TaxID=933084 RepID=A0A067QFN5_9AGAM|nr:hypothetical protein JAAARDRAFT_190185 [Jaapia argillacea MUCL 33604]